MSKNAMKNGVEKMTVRPKNKKRLNVIVVHVECQTALQQNPWRQDITQNSWAQCPERRRKEGKQLLQSTRKAKRENTSTPRINSLADKTK